MQAQLPLDYALYMLIQPLILVYASSTPLKLCLVHVNSTSNSSSMQAKPPLNYGLYTLIQPLILVLCKLYSP